MKRKLFPIIAIICMAFVFIPIFTSAEETPFTTMDIDGITDYDLTKELHGTGWAWNPATETLTLDGYDGEMIAVYGGNKLKINLLNSNKITSSRYYGIITTDASVNISGTGSLSITSQLAAINATGDIEVSGSGNRTFISTFYDAIRTRGGVAFSGSGKCIVRTTYDDKEFNVGEHHDAIHADDDVSLGGTAEYNIESVCGSGIVTKGDVFFSGSGDIKIAGTYYTIDIETIGKWLYYNCTAKTIELDGRVYVKTNGITYYNKGESVGSYYYETGNCDTDYSLYKYFVGISEFSMSFAEDGIKAGQDLTKIRPVYTSNQFETESIKWYEYRNETWTEFTGGTAPQLEMLKAKIQLKGKDLYSFVNDTVYTLNGVEYEVALGTWVKHTYVVETGSFFIMDDGKMDTPVVSSVGFKKITEPEIGKKAYEYAGYGEEDIEYYNDMTETEKAKWLEGFRYETADHNIELNGVADYRILGMELYKGSKLLDPTDTITQGEYTAKVKIQAKSGITIDETGSFQIGSIIPSYKWKKAGTRILELTFPLEVYSAASSEVLDITGTTLSQTGPGWTWDAEGKILTLNGYNGNNIVISIPAKIVLADGSKNVVTPKIGFSPYVILLYENALITGNGSLEIRNPYYREYNGIASGGKLTVKTGGTIRIKGMMHGIFTNAFESSGTGNMDINAWKYGIETDGGNVDISGKLSITSQLGEASIGIKTSGNINVSDQAVLNISNVMNGIYGDLYSSENKMSIRNAKVDISCADSGIEMQEISLEKKSSLSVTKLDSSLDDSGYRGIYTYSCTIKDDSRAYVKGFDYGIISEDIPEFYGHHFHIELEANKAVLISYDESDEMIYKYKVIKELETITEDIGKVKQLKLAPETESKIENTIPATYTKEGSYDEVSYCKDCGEELSRETIKTPMKTLAKPAITSAENSTSGITVKWKKVTGAENYKLEYKAGNGAWKTAATTAALSTTKKSLSNGTKYSFRVTALAGSNQSAVSTAKVAYRLTTPTISSAKNVKGKKIKVTLKAKNVKASGYQIKYVNGKKTKTATIKSYKTRTKTIAKLTKGKTYTIYARAYKTVSKQNYYSAWSKAKKVKVVK